MRFSTDGGKTWSDGRPQFADADGKVFYQSDRWDDYVCTRAVSRPRSVTSTAPVGYAVTIFAALSRPSCSIDVSRILYF